MGKRALVVMTWLVCLAAVAGTWGCSGVKSKALDGPKMHGADALSAGDAALAHGDINDAGRYYLMALKSGADPVKAHIRLGNLYLRTGTWDKARVEYDKVLQADAKNSQALQGMGFALFLSGAKQKAIETLTRALEHDPGLSQAAALLGTMENREGHPEAALAIFDKSLAAHFDPAVANNRGISLMMLGRTGDAIEAFNQALTAKKSAKFVNNLGLALCRERHYDEAYAAFASVGSEAAALNNIGVCYMEAGDKVRAQQSFERAIAINPTYYEKAQTNLSRLSASEEVPLPTSPETQSQTTQTPAPETARQAPLAPAPVKKAPATKSTPPVAKPAPVAAKPMAPVAKSAPIVAPGSGSAKTASPGAMARPTAREQADRAEMP